MQGVPLRAWGCPFSDHSKTAHELRRSLFPVLSNQDGFPTVYTGFPAELSPSLTRVASAGKVGNPPGRVSYLASVLEDTTGSGESGKRSGGCRQHVRNVHAPRTRYNAPRTRQRSWRHGNTSPVPKRPGIIPRARCIVRKLRKWRGRLWKTRPLASKTPLRPLCLPVSRTPGSKVGEDAQRGAGRGGEGGGSTYTPQDFVQSLIRQRLTRFRNIRSS